MAVIAAKVGGIIFFSNIATGRLSMRATLIKLSEQEKKKKTEENRKDTFWKGKGIQRGQIGVKRG